MAENSQIALENIVSAAAMGVEYIFEDVKTGLFDFAVQKQSQFTNNLPQSAYEFGLVVGELSAFLKISLNELLKSRSLGFSQKEAIKQIKESLEQRSELNLELIAAKIELVDDILKSIKS